MDMHSSLAHGGFTFEVEQHPTNTDGAIKGQFVPTDDSDITFDQRACP